MTWGIVSTEQDAALGIEFISRILAVSTRAQHQLGLYTIFFPSSIHPQRCDEFSFRDRERHSAGELETQVI